MSARLLWMLCFMVQAALLAVDVAIHAAPWGFVFVGAMALYSLVMAAVSKP